jgi:hypothetical protein
VWTRAGSFFVRHAAVLVAMTPLLVLPFVSDALLAALIDQDEREEHLRPGAALQRALRALPVVARLKLYYYARATAWSLVPVYGLFRDVDERLAWAMSSNVVVLEGRTDFSTGRMRCQALAAAFRGECIRTLITMPCLLILPIAILLALAVSPWIFWTAVAAFVWLWLPGSAAANTYLFLWMREDERSRGAVAPSAADLRMERALVS